MRKKGDTNVNSVERRRKIHELYSLGFSMAEIGRRMGLDHTSIIWHLGHRGIRGKSIHSSTQKGKKELQYKDRVRDFYTKKFIRDAVGNLIRVEIISFNPALLKREEL